MTSTKTRLLVPASLAIILGACSRSPEKAFHKGVTYFKEQKFSQAAACFENAIAHRSPTAQALNFLGVCKLQNGKTDEAILHFQEALKLDNSHAPSHYNLGLALLDQGKIDDAIQHLRQAVQSPAAPPDAQYQLGVAYTRAAAWGQAKRVFEKVAETDKTAPVCNYLGIVNAHLSDFKQARQNFEQAIATAPTFAPAYLNLAVVEHRHVNQKQAAMLHYQKYLDLLPKSQPREDVRLTILQLAQESATRPKPIEVTATPAPAKAPEPPKPVEVTPAAKPEPPPVPPVVTAPPVAPASPATPAPPPPTPPAPVVKHRIPVSPHLAKTGNRTKAKAFFNEGVALQQQNKTGAAIVSYTKAIATDPSYAQAYYNLAIAYRDAHQPDRALDNYELALIANPGFSDARFNYAILLQQEGYVADALAVYEQILAANPNDSAVQLTVATLYARDRETWPKARQHYEAFLKLSPNSPPARDVRRWLDQNR